MLKYHLKEYSILLIGLLDFISFHDEEVPNHTYLSLWQLIIFSGTSVSTANIFVDVSNKDP